MNEEYLYHGTSSASADHIRKNGFDPTTSKYGGKVFLTATHREAAKYAKIADGHRGVVLKVHKDKLDPTHVHSDYAGIVQYSGKIGPEHVSDV